MNKIKEIFVIFLFLIFCINSSNSTIKDSIIGTVGDKQVTSSDLINEMKMLLITNGENFSEVDKKKLQELAVQSITPRLIKKIEIEKYNSNNFNEEDVMNEIGNIANKLNINVDNLKLKLIDIIVFQDDSVIIKGVNKNDCIVNQYRHYFYDGMLIN